VIAVRHDEPEVSPRRGPSGSPVLRTGRMATWDGRMPDSTPFFGIGDRERVRRTPVTAAPSPERRRGKRRPATIEIPEVAEVDLTPRPGSLAWRTPLLIPRLRVRAWRAGLAILITVAAAYWYFAAATAAISRGLPAVAGWSTAVVVGGSMEPVLSPGDVIAFAPYGGQALAPGAIIAFDDPAHPGVIVTHRVVATNADGSFQTKGDANATPDSTPVPPEAVIGIARLVSPGAGLPFYWWRTGNIVSFAVWIALSAAALVLATRRLPGERRREKRRHRPGPALLAAMAMIGGVVVAGWTTAAMSAATTNTGNGFAAAWAAHQGMVASGSCGGTSTVMSVTGTAATAGRTVVIQVAVRNPSGAVTFSAIDSRGNTYTVDVIASDPARSAVAIISSTLTTGLGSGDSIQVFHPANQASAARADVYSGIATTSRVVTIGTGTGNSAGASVTVNTAVADTVVVGVVATQGASIITQPASWIGLEFGNVACGPTLGRAEAWTAVHTASAVTYDPSFAASARWSAAVVVYRTISS